MVLRMRLASRLRRSWMITAFWLPFCLAQLWFGLVAPLEAHASDRLVADAEAKQAFRRFYLFTKGRGMHLVPDFPVLLWASRGAGAGFDHGSVESPADVESAT